MRGVGDACKSVARLVCPDSECHRYDGWDTEYIRTTCRVQLCFGPVKVLGVVLGPDGAADEGLVKTLANVARAREGICTLDDPAAELVLTRRCLDVSKVNYQLRCNGDRLSPDFLTNETGLHDSVESILNGAL